MSEQTKPKRGRPPSGNAMSSGERVYNMGNRNSAVTYRECADPERRKQLEANRAEWMRYYFGGVFFRPFESPHMAIIDGSTEAVQTGERFAVLAERGIGKSVIEWSLAILDVVTEKSIFPAYVPWQAIAVKRAFRFWRNALCFNPLLMADYPEFCAPFAHSKGVSQRLAATWWKGGPHDGEPTGAQLAISDGMIVLPDCRGCIGSATINGNPRGLNFPTPDGRVLRPTSAILDDVQDRDVAKSERMIRETIRIIDGDVAGMGEAGVKMPMLMSGNCIEHGDVMAHYLDAENWNAIRIPCVLSWPEGWDDGDGETAQLWFEWYGKYKAKDPHKTWYRKHKKELTKGFELSAPGVFADKPEFPDAYCAVIESYFRMGKESFSAEKQQQPIKQGVTLFTITPKIIEARADKNRKAGEIPDWVRMVVAATDINPSYALSTVIVGFGQDQRAAVLWYGIHKMDIAKDIPDAQKKRAIMLELEKHGKDLALLPCCPDRWVIDGGGSPQETVVTFSANSVRTCGIESLTAFGRAWRQFRPKQSDRKYEQVFVRAQSRQKRWALWNADYWRENAQKSWLGAIGAPGSCDLPRGNHRDFAEQICREQLSGKAEAGGTWVYVWNTLPGPHDYGDCMAMAFAMAAISGIGTGGQEVRRKKKRAVALVGGKRVGG